MFRFIGLLFLATLMIWSGFPAGHSGYVFPEKSSSAALLVELPESAPEVDFCIDCVICLTPCVDCQLRSSPEGGLAIVGFIPGKQTGFAPRLLGKPISGFINNLDRPPII